MNRPLRGTRDTPLETIKRMSDDLSVSRPAVAG